MNYFSESGMNHLRNAFSVSLAVTILLVPVFLLFLVHMTRVQMVLTAATFIIPFPIILSYMTGAKDAEIFVGTATYVFQAPAFEYTDFRERYAALLMVFLGNIAQGNAACVMPA